MSVDLSELRLRAAPPALQEFGGVLTPPTGGVVQTIERVGTRWAMKFETPQVDWEPEGRRWASLLSQARREGARVPIPQPGLAIGAPGLPLVGAATLSGRLVPLTGLTVGYVIRLGQWLTIEADGVGYADQFAEQVVADASGGVTVKLTNLLRVALAGGETVQIGKPTIEGSITEFGEYAVDTDEITSFSFTVSEDA